EQTDVLAGAGTQLGQRTGQAAGLVVELCIGGSLAVEGAGGIIRKSLGRGLEKAAERKPWIGNSGGLVTSAKLAPELPPAVWIRYRGGRRPRRRGEGRG